MLLPPAFPRLYRCPPPCSCPALPNLCCFLSLSFFCSEASFFAFLLPPTSFQSFFGRGNEALKRHLLHGRQHIAGIRCLEFPSHREAVGTGCGIQHKDAGGAGGDADTVPERLLGDAGDAGDGQVQILGPLRPGRGRDQCGLRFRLLRRLHFPHRHGPTQRGCCPAPRGPRITSFYISL